MRDSENAKGSEEAIEKVLAGLGDAQAPAGMERRILARLKGRVSVAEVRSGWRRLVPIGVTMPAGPVATRALVCGAALAGLVAVVLWVPAIRRVGHVPAQSKSGRVTGAPVGTVPAMTATEAEASSGGRIRSGTTAKVPDAVLVRPADSREASSDEESLARSEMQAASFPAPPMPLTAQERLLLRLAHKVDPVEMAMLDPKFRASEDAKEKAEFQRFFGQTPVKMVDSAEASGSKSTADQAVQPPATDQGVKVQTSSDEAAPATDQEGSATQDKSNQKQAAPESSSPDQSTTQ